jgi:ppGpp synthetase/RelA/SpoT-type nucleotidyltranferase
MSKYEEARVRWLADRASFEEFGKELHARLKKALRKEGIWAEVSSRAKDMDSLIRKLNKKPQYTYDTLGDRSGVRVIVRHKDEIEPVVEIAERLFACANRENKVDTLGPETVGYLSTHLDVRLRNEDSLLLTYPPSKFQAELQVRTLAQHLWSEMSHDAFYKNDDTLNPLSTPLKRRVYLLAGTLEVADNEFNRLNMDMPSVPEVGLLKALEKHYYKLTARRSDAEVSLDLIRVLLPLYNQTPAQVAAHLDEFYESHEATLQTVYDDAEKLPDRSAYLYQPEALMIYDLLESNQAETRKSWAVRYPERELERIANAFGISFD